MATTDAVADPLEVRRAWFTLRARTVPGSYPTQEPAERHVMVILETQAQFHREFGQQYAPCRDRLEDHRRSLGLARHREEGADMITRSQAVRRIPAAVLTICGLWEIGQRAVDWVKAQD